MSSDASNAPEGGALRLHLPGGGARDVQPAADLLLLFRSQLEHEVLELHEGAGRPRCAVTQWFQDLAPPLLASTGLVGGEGELT